MGNAIRKNEQFDNQPDDTSEHDTDLLLDCVTFQCARRNKKADDESASQKKASSPRTEQEIREREKRFKEAAEKRRQEKSDQIRKQEEEEEQKRRECVEAHKRQKAKDKEEKEKAKQEAAAVKTPFFNKLLDAFRPRQKTPEELREEEAQRIAKEEAIRREKEEKMRRQAEKARATAERARENVERRARENEERRARESEKRGSLADTCCVPFNRAADSLATEGPRPTPEEIAARDRRKKEREEARRRKTLEKELEKEAKKAQEDAERQRARLAENERKKQEMEEAERQRLEEKNRLDGERAKKPLTSRNSDLDLKWCGNICGKPQDSPSTSGDSLSTVPEKKEARDSKPTVKPIPERPAKVETKPVLPAIKEEPEPVPKPVPAPVIIKEPVPCPPCPQPPVVQTQTQGAQTEPVHCQAKVEKVDTTTMVTPSLTFGEKAAKTKDLQKIKAEKLDASTMISPSMSYETKDSRKPLSEETFATPCLSIEEEAPEQTSYTEKKISKIDASTMITPCLSTEEHFSTAEECKKDEADKKTASQNLGLDDKAMKQTEQPKIQRRKIDADTMVSESLLFGKDRSKKSKPESVKVEKADEADKMTTRHGLGLDDQAMNQTEQPKSQRRKIDADTMVSESLLLGKDHSKKSKPESVKVEKANVGTMVQPSSSLDQTKVKRKRDSDQKPRVESFGLTEDHLDTDRKQDLKPSLKKEDHSESPRKAQSETFSKSDVPLDLSKTTQNIKKEIEALEKALNIKSEPKEYHDINQDEMKSLGALPSTSTGRPRVGKADAATQFTADDSKKDAKYSIESSPSGAIRLRAVSRRDQGNQTAPWRFDFEHDSSEKIMTATWQRKPDQAIDKHAKTATQSTQTDCDCGGRPSITAINVQQAVSHRTGFNIVKRSIATQTEFCSCNYEESSLSGDSSSDGYWGKR